MYPCKRIHVAPLLIDTISYRIRVFITYLIELTCKVRDAQKAEYTSTIDDIGATYSISPYVFHTHT